MSFREKLDERLNSVEDRFDRLNEKSAYAEKKFVEKHAASIDKYLDARDQAKEKLEHAKERTGRWFENWKESMSERAERKRMRRTR